MPFFSVGFSSSFNLRSREDPGFLFGFLGTKETGALTLANVNLLHECSGMSMGHPLPRNCSFQIFSQALSGFQMLGGKEAQPFMPPSPGSQLAQERFWIGVISNKREEKVRLIDPLSSQQFLCHV